MPSNKEQKDGTLFIVPTPIGNLEDITMRSLRTLKEVDLIAAEDTRHTKRLLNHFDIDTPLISYYREKEVERSKEILRRLQEGQNIALVSDAGTPCISDPGAVVVNLLYENGLTVVPLPGPSALTTALSGSGITSVSGIEFPFSQPTKDTITTANKKIVAIPAAPAAEFIINFLLSIMVLFCS